jgi:dihydrodipicolinate reductase
MGFKLLISGATGRIGAQVLEHALSDPNISFVIVLSRRPLPELVRHNRMEIVVLEDFTKYTDEVVAKLSGADGCLWYQHIVAADGDEC